ncbi:uncharacterized protein N7498_008384 [Penicillium cinerascens]|uniref:Cytochrome b561 domain-containing protein n=1 Tax=Penicillium cinerascens TaxID=70096 RepID=A0A9W9JF93_9EURO|nr:uncharacterized protein N7498_008384 [Penicillium cinerascens]KAJ5194946.1 hypothetical protein N7498_008384 [Penicillium cinerascens]
MLVAHGFLMSLAFVIFFPFFAIIVSIPSIPISVTKVHAPLQLSTLAMVIAGLGLGIKLGLSGDLMKNAHPIIGLVVVGLLRWVYYSTYISSEQEAKASFPTCTAG